MTARAPWLRALALALGAGVVAGVAPAQRVDAMFPRGAERGTEVELTFVGVGIGGAVGVLSSEPLVEVLGVEGVDDKRATARVQVAVDCPFGPHQLTLYTTRGLCRLQTFWVGALPELVEEEPNDSRAGAQALDLDVTVNGRVRAEDADWFAFEAAAGQRLSFEVVGIRLGGPSWDPQLTLFDEQGGRLARADDSTLGRDDPILSFVFERAGRYLIELRDAAYGGAGNAFYRLHVGTFPRPVGAVPCGGRPGEEIEVEMLEPAGARREKVVLQGHEGLQAHFARDGERTAPTPVYLVVRDIPCFREADVPNGDEGEPLSPPFAVHGVLSESGETDRFRVALRKGEQVEVLAIARTLRSPLDAFVQVRDASRRALASNDDVGRPDSRTLFRAPADGVYTVWIFDQLRRGGAEFFYRLEVAEPRTGAVLGEAVPGRRAEDAGVAVPRGGRAATLIAAARLERGAGVSLRIDGLPPGVEVEAPAFQPGADTVPVLFRAAGAAEVAASLADVGVSTAEGPVEPAARFAHEVPLVRVFNDQVLISTWLRRLPVAVTEPCPFAVELAPPAVPIVRGSPLDLEVTLRRDEGFDGAVRLRMLWNPPGIGSGQVDVAKDRGEGRITLSANGNAPVMTWRIAILATASVGGIERTVSSELCDLEVQEPWIDATIGAVRVEQGQKARLEVALERKRDFDGDVVAELSGLPRGVGATPPSASLGAGARSVEFELAVDEKAPPGRHRGHVLRLRVPTPRGEVVHQFTGGEIRIDRPLPKTAAKESAAR